MSQRNNGASNKNKPQTGRANASVPQKSAAVQKTGGKSKQSTNSATTPSSASAPSAAATAAGVSASKATKPAADSTAAVQAAGPAVTAAAASSTAIAQTAVSAGPAGKAVAASSPAVSQAANCSTAAATTEISSSSDQQKSNSVTPSAEAKPSTANQQTGDRPSSVSVAASVNSSSAPSITPAQTHISDVQLLQITGGLMGANESSPIRQEALVESSPICKESSVDPLSHKQDQATPMSDDIYKPRELEPCDEALKNSNDVTTTAANGVTPAGKNEVTQATNEVAKDVAPTGTKDSKLKLETVATVKDEEADALANSEDTRRICEEFKKAVKEDLAEIEKGVKIMRKNTKPSEPPVLDKPSVEALDSNKTSTTDDASRTLGGEDKIRTEADTGDVEDDLEVTGFMKSADKRTEQHVSDTSLPSVTSVTAVASNSDTEIIMKKTFTESVQPNQEFVPIRDEVAKSTNKDASNVSNAASEATPVDALLGGEIDVAVKGRVLTEALTQAQDLKSDFRRLQNLLDDLSHFEAVVYKAQPIEIASHKPVVRRRRPKSTVEGEEQSEHRPTASETSQEQKSAQAERFENSSVTESVVVSTVAAEGVLPDAVDRVASGDIVHGEPLNEMHSRCDSDPLLLEPAVSTNTSMSGDSSVPIDPVGNDTVKCDGDPVPIQPIVKETVKCDGDLVSIQPIAKETVKCDGEPVPIQPLAKETIKCDGEPVPIQPISKETVKCDCDPVSIETIPTEA